MESPLRPDTPAVIETFAWDGAEFARLAAHLGRARSTCAALGLAFDKSAINTALSAAPAGTPARTRLLICGDGPTVSFAPLSPNPAEWRVALHPQRLHSTDRWLQMKTTNRALYDIARAALPDGVDEYLFLNERDELCEGTISNLFIRRGETLLTPPGRCGLLPGILRAELLGNARAEAAVLHPDDLHNTDIFMGNALRGLIAVALVG